MTLIGPQRDVYRHPNVLMLSVRRSQRSMRSLLVHASLWAYVMLFHSSQGRGAGMLSSLIYCETNLMALLATFANVSVLRRVLARHKIAGGFNKLTSIASGRSSASIACEGAFLHSYSKSHPKEHPNSYDPFKRFSILMNDIRKARRSFPHSDYRSRFSQPQDMMAMWLRAEPRDLEPSMPAPETSPSF